MDKDLSQLLDFPGTGPIKVSALVLVRDQATGKDYRASLERLFTPVGLYKVRTEVRSSDRIAGSRNGEESSWTVAQLRDFMAEELAAAARPTYINGGTPAFKGPKTKNPYI